MSNTIFRYPNHGVIWAALGKKIIKEGGKTTISPSNNNGNPAYVGTKTVAIVTNFVFLDMMTGGYGTSIYGLRHLPQYYSDPRMTQLVNDVTGLFGISAEELMMSLQACSATAAYPLIASEAVHFVLGNIAYWKAEDDIDYCVTDFNDALDRLGFFDYLVEIFNNYSGLNLVGINTKAVSSDVSTLFTTAFNDQWSNPNSPIVLDLDGDGVETVGSDSAGAVMFDHDGDGRQNLGGWVSPDDGILTLDRNGDGQINDGGELFGDNTRRYDGSGFCADGFEALAQAEIQGSGVVHFHPELWAHSQTAASLWRFSW